MTTWKACKNCKRIVEKGKKCPYCGGELTTNWKGMVVIIDPEKSEVAKLLGFTTPGKYAIRVGRS